MPIVIETLSIASEAAWDAYVDAHPEATCYHHRAWQTAAREAYGIKTPSLIARDEQGAIAGVLPLFIVKRAWSSYGVTAIFGGYGRVLGTSDEVRRDLLEESRRVSARFHLSHLLHKSTGEEPVSDEWGRGDAAVTATLSLEPGESALWKGFRGEIRNRVRKGEASGLKAREGESEFEAFYEVLSANMHRKGTPIYGRPFLRSVLQAFGPRASIMTVRRGEETVGGALLVEHRNEIHVPFISSIPSAFALAPNNFLYWEIIKRSCARGLTLLDFGRSFRGTSNLDFKVRWGARVVAQPFYYVHRGAPPIIEPGGSMVRSAVSIWRRLPRGFADRVGPTLAGRLLV
jgi:FemAB-related protein (PEP-CTERM system-associated)